MKSKKCISKKQNDKKIKIMTIHLWKVLVVILTVAFVVRFVANYINLEQTTTSSYSAESTIQAAEIDTNKVTLVTSKDGETVPVPKGYTASSIESEMYVNGGTETKYVTTQELTFPDSDNDTYPWKKNSDGVWVSGNGGDDPVDNSASTLISEEFTIGEGGGKIVINLSYSCAYDKDTYLQISLGSVATTYAWNSTNLGTSYSGLRYLEEEIELGEGTYTLTVIYARGETVAGTDSGYIESAKVYNYVDEGTANATTITEKIEGGFVIYEGEEEVTEDNLYEAQTTRNQWVWVPVDSTELANMYHEDTTSEKIYSNYYTFSSTGSTKYTTYSYEPQVISSNYDGQWVYLSQYLNGLSREDLLSDIEQEYMEMLQSIATYGGFYIGRYETGNLNSSIPVVQKMQTDLGSQTWYNMYLKVHNIDSDNENVKTHMIYGAQWDVTLRWLISSSSKEYTELADSTDWGNYRNASFPYTNTSGGKSTKGIYSSTKIPTGSTDRNMTNNIYDMAGNVWDWTMESYGDGYNHRYFRGGFYTYQGNFTSVSYRSGNFPSNSADYIGCRAALYIE